MVKMSEDAYNQIKSGGSSTNYSNRGKGLEKAIEVSNQQYKLENKALVNKAPEPYKQIGKNRPDGSFLAVRTTKAIPDYTGTYKNHSLLFDAKETKVETRFDLKNVEDHQYEDLKLNHECGGISFLIISFTSLDEIYYLPFELLDKYWREKYKGGRKSIPYGEIAKKKYKIGNDVDYLEIVERVIK